MFQASTIVPATNGARPPPMNRMKPYAEEAIGRSTGATSMTAWVVSVLLRPTTMPDAITQTTSAQRVSVNSPMSSSRTAKKPRAP